MDELEYMDVLFVNDQPDTYVAKIADRMLKLKRSLFRPSPKLLRRSMAPGPTKDSRTVTRDSKPMSSPVAGVGLAYYIVPYVFHTHPLV